MTGSELDGVELLSSMPAAARAALAQRCAWRTYRTGEAILSRDEPGNTVLFITRGRVQIVNYALSGREVAFAVIDAGGIVGELAAIDGAPRSASVVALTETRVGALEAPAFLRLLVEETAVALALLRRLARVIRDNGEKITELATLGAMQRVYRELLRLARPQPEGAGQLVIDDLPTQEALAARLGTTRETVARVLAQLVRDGITERRGRILRILEPEELEILADQ